MRNLLPVAASVLAAACAMQPGEVNLARSFAEQIAAVEGVTDFRNAENTMSFTGPDGRGGTASWRVEIQSTELVSTGERPTEGHVVSFWYRDAELVFPLRQMSLLPDEFLDAGVAQRCYALWDEAANRWDW